MIEIVKAIPSLAKEAFKVLKELLNDSDESIKFAVIDGIVEIVKANLNLAKKTFKMLKELLSDDVVMYSAIDSMVKVVKIMHTTEAFDTLKELLSGLDIDNYTHSYVKGEAVRSLKEVVKAMHVESAFKALKELVDGPNKTLKYAAIWSLVVVIEIKPSTTEEVFIILKKVN
ncbi:HEAT repeat domain-containing protein [Rickettsia felis]|nr:hypothetical protein [Rickettsia felis]